MFAAVTDYFGLFSAIILLVLGSAATWFTAKRTTKGDISTSKAEDLWEEQRAELNSSRAEVTALKNEAIDARKEAKALREETFALREELLTLRVESKVLREETVKLREEMVLARVDVAKLNGELKECLGVINKRQPGQQGR